MYENFVGLFLHIQIKSYSEALCETVGSIMMMVEEEMFTLWISIRRFIFVLTFIFFKKESSISEAVKLKLVEAKKSFPKQQEKISWNLDNFHIQWGILGTRKMHPLTFQSIHSRRTSKNVGLCHLQAVVILFVSQPRIALKYMLTSRLNRYCQCSIGYP